MNQTDIRQSISKMLIFTNAVDLTGQIPKVFLR